MHSTPRYYLSANRSPFLLSTGTGVIIALSPHPRLKCRSLARSFPEALVDEFRHMCDPLVAEIPVPEGRGCFDRPSTDFEVRVFSCKLPLTHILRRVPRISRLPIRQDMYVCIPAAREVTASTLVRRDELANDIDILKSNIEGEHIRDYFFY